MLRSLNLEPLSCRNSKQLNNARLPRRKAAQEEERGREMARSRWYTFEDIKFGRVVHPRTLGEATTWIPPATSDQDVGKQKKEIMETIKCRICGKQCGGPESLDQHWKMSGKCKQKRLARIRQQCELGVLPEGHVPGEHNTYKFEVKTINRFDGIETALT